MVINGAPHVSIREIDQTTRVPSFPGVVGAITIPADRGPLSPPQLCTNSTQFLKLFTFNDRVEVEHDLSYFSALAFLEKSNALWVQRAIGDGYKYGGATVYGLTESPRVETVNSALANPNTDTIPVTNNWLTGSAVKVRSSSVPNTVGDILTIIGNATNTTVWPYDVIVNISDVAGNVSPGVRLINSNDDPMAPQVTELGDGTADFVILAGATAQLSFNDSLSSTGKTAVEAAITAGASTTLGGFSWNGDSTVLTITGNPANDVTFANDVYADVTSVSNYIRAGLRLVNSGDDPLPPYCTAVGTGLVDFSLPASGTATISFSEPLSPASRTAIETAIQSKTNRPVAFTWQLGVSVDTLPPPLNSTDTYFVINVDSATIKLASSLENANAGIAINLTSGGIGNMDLTYVDWASGEVNPEAHDFSEEPGALFVIAGCNPGIWNDSVAYKLWIKRNPESVDLATQVSVANKTFAVTQTWVTGEPVRVKLGSKGASDSLPSYDDNGTVRKMANNGTYYVIGDGTTNIKLAETPSNANAGIAINLTNEGYGTLSITPTVDIKEPDSLCPFLIQLFKRGDMVNPVESYLVSRIPGAKDGFSRNMYIEDKLRSSYYARVFDNVLSDPTVLPKPQPTAKFLTGGNNGQAVTDGKMILSSEAFENPENIAVTLLMDGGWSTIAYQKQLIGLAEKRKDCVSILSIPYEAEANSDYINAVLDYRREELNANTSHAAIYSSHTRIYDRYNDRRIYVSPDGYACAQISETAANYEMWYPVGGNRRGVLNVEDVRVRYTKGEMDLLYNNGVNPIRFTKGKGIRIWGQKTLLARPSALDRLNVRLLLVVIEPAIAEALENFLFELNDDATYAIVRLMIESYMNGIKARRGVYDFRVVCDDSNNTPEDIDNYILHVDLYIKPTKSIEYIPFTVVITPTGMDFSIAQNSI